MLEFFAVAGGVLAVAFGLFWRWRARILTEIEEGARLEFDRLTAADPEFLAGYDFEKFHRVYRLVHYPRFPGYALACVASFLAALPIIFILLAGGLLFAGAVGWLPEPAEIADRYLVEGDRMRIITAAPSEAALIYVETLGGFYYFFGVIFSWLVIVGFFTRRFHSRRPGYLRDEIIRNR